MPIPIAKSNDLFTTRHPGEGRGPVPRLAERKNWIPAFAGMTVQAASNGTKLLATAILHLPCWRGVMAIVSGRVKAAQIRSCEAGTSCSWRKSCRSSKSGSGPIFGGAGQSEGNPRHRSTTINGSRILKLVLTGRRYRLGKVPSCQDYENIDLLRRCGQ